MQIEAIKELRMHVTRPKVVSRVTIVYSKHYFSGGR